MMAQNWTTCLLIMHLLAAPCNSREVPARTENVGEDHTEEISDIRVAKDNKTTEGIHPDIYNITARLYHSYVNPFFLVCSTK